MNVIVANGIEKKFGSSTIFNNLDFFVEKNEIVAIVGQSGKGKTTLLRCLTGLEKVSCGTIEIDGRKLVEDGKYVKKRDKVEILSRIGIVFQNYGLFLNLTAIENLMIVKDDEQMAENLLKRFGLLEKRDLHPADLSGGQQQRLAIIRALMLSPEIVFFDEPTSALDDLSCSEIVKLIKELKFDGYTVVVVTHDKRLVDGLNCRIYEM